MKRVTQEDIAKKLNITRTTVARALNNNGYVEAGLKERILLTAEEMGYKTNLIARSLAKKGVWNIYCFLVSYNDDYARELESGLRSVESEFQHYGFKLHVIKNNPNEPELQVRKLESVLSSEQIDGLIISPMMNKEINELIESRAVKTLRIGSLNVELENERSLFHVGNDLEESGVLAADLLSKLMSNKGRIVVFNAFNQFKALYLRYHGFMNEISKNKDIEIVETVYLESIQDSYKAAKEILKRYDDLDGMYTNTEIIYLSRALKESNRKSVQLIGNDLNDEIKGLIRDGYISMALHSRPYFQGYLAGKYMFRILLNNIYPSRKTTNVGFDIVTSVNLQVEDTFRILTSD
ncbi:MAG: substrate-binding domain-containing protein [Spirochaetales bacterium]|nr:substrate-binding domain-containing protein [Spirochaetales bacterium]